MAQRNSAQPGSTQLVFEPPPSPVSYDEYLGSFVDAVQLSAVDYLQLRVDWLAGCPGLWQQRFTADLAEIEWLMRAGALCRNVA